MIIQLCRDVPRTLVYKRLKAPKSVRMQSGGESKTQSVSGLPSYCCVFAIFVSGLTVVVLSADAVASAGTSYVQSSILPPAPIREFRGAWVPSVGNIDWPSKKGLSTAEQKAELLALL